MEENFANVIWIDPVVDNNENIQYLKDLQKYKYLNVKGLKDVKSAIAEIKKIQYEETNIILSGKLYTEFIEQFKKNIKDIRIIPKFYVFSQNFKLTSDKKEPHFYISGVKDDFKEIKKTILKPFMERIKNIQNEGQLSIEYIDRKEKLILPTLYQSLIDETNYDEINKFNKIIYEKYSKENNSWKKLLNSIVSTREIPIELLSKYYAIMYKIESNNDDNIFHFNMNNYLRSNEKFDIYLPYIKTLYKGIKLKILPFASNQILFRGAFLHKNDINNIIKNRNKEIPGFFAFSREFLSFYKEKKIAENFLIKNHANNVDLIKVLLILEKGNLPNNIDIENISNFQNEKEVLFLPFSSFEIKGIKEIIIINEKGYEIKLSEKTLIEFNISKINNETIIYETEFKKQIDKSGLIKSEQINNYNNLILTYNQYKNPHINNNKINDNHNNPITTNYINKNNLNNLNNSNKSNNNPFSAKTQITKKKRNNKLNQGNYISGIINITEEDINREIQVINSYEELKRKRNTDLKHENYSEKDDYKRENEIEIRQNCEIQINERKLNFSYFYKFGKPGQYKIKYIFKNNLTKLDFMFYNCDSLIDLDLSNFNSENVTNMEYMFYYCSSLINLNVSNLNTQKVTNMKSMFYSCKLLSSLNLSNFNTENTTNMENMFSNCESLQVLNLSNFKTDKVTKMNSMFRWCDKLTYLNIPNFNTQNVTDMESMFSDCHSLNNLKIPNFNTQNVTNMKSMFSSCYSLKKLNLSNFNTQNVTNMECMFNSCSSLQILDISKFNTQNVTNMGSMFCNCKSLINLNLSNFNTKNVTNMYSMFAKCESLTEINLSNFTSEKADIDSMFEGSKSIKNINSTDAKILEELNKKK